MIDDHNACPACPMQVRNLYAVGRRVLERERTRVRFLSSAEERSTAIVEYEELYLTLEALRPFVDAHYANQLHAFSKELAAAREPQLDPAVPA
jgi:hypothetical protein